MECLMVGRTGVDESPIHISKICGNLHDQFFHCSLCSLIRIDVKGFEDSMKGGMGQSAPFANHER